MFWISIICGCILFWLALCNQLPNHLDDWVDEHHGYGSTVDEWGLDRVDDLIARRRSGSSSPNYR